MPDAVIWACTYWDQVVVAHVGAKDSQGHRWWKWWASVAHVREKSHAEVVEETVVIGAGPHELSVAQVKEQLHKDVVDSGELMQAS